MPSLRVVLALMFVSVVPAVAAGGCGNAKSETGSQSSSPDSGSSSKCTYKGSCGPKSDDCKCGLDCVHLQSGSYVCGISCESSADCEGVTNPVTGNDDFTGCQKGSLGGFCI